MCRTSSRHWCMCRSVLHDVHVLLVLPIVLIVQLNCCLQFLEIKILLVSFAPAVKVGDDLISLTKPEMPRTELLKTTHPARR